MFVPGPPNSPGRVGLLRMAEEDWGTGPFPLNQQWANLFEGHAHA